jgi:mono/diheme cytochrome c family protein
MPLPRYGALTVGAGLFCAGLYALASGPEVPRPDADALVDAPVPAQADVNYAQHVAPILNRSCVSCHRPGEVAPFSLVGYDNARRWAKMVEIVTESRRMPPWPAVQGFGEFEGEARLSRNEIETLRRWAAAGAPRGDSSKEPIAPSFESEWVLGTPDLILQPDREYLLEADGKDVYRNFVIRNTSTETKWVRAMDVRPGNARVVHHVIAFLDSTKQARRQEDANKDGQPGYSTFGGIGFLPSGAIGGWAPGLRPSLSRPGTAFRIDPGTDVVLQVHYNKTGKPERDRTQIALYLDKEAPEREIQIAWFLDLALNIPPGVKEHRVKITRTAPVDMTLYGVMPHMHLLGRSMKAEVELPDGSRKPVVYVDDWDFNWQLHYTLKEPMKLPKGSKLHIEAVYDNSESNPRNPSNPPKRVRWGEETTDEMFLLVATYTIDDPKVTQKFPLLGVGFGG